MNRFEYIYDTYSNNMTSKGPEECKNDTRSIITYESGAKYEGVSKDGKRHGKGTMTYTNGDKYEGDWEDNKRHGKGTFTWANGKKYKGDWVDDKRHGKGTQTWADGDKYKGGWVDDKKHGTGTYTWPNGANYEGNWKNGKNHGNGKMKLRYNSDKLEQCGRWVNGEKSGSFVIGYKNGDIELKNYRNNRPLSQRIRFNILHLDQAYMSKYDSRCTTNECIRWTNIPVEEAISIAYHNFNIDMDKDESDNIKVFPDYGNEYPCNKYITGFLKQMIEIIMPLHYNINRREIEKNRNSEITAIIYKTSWDKRDSLITYSYRVHSYEY